MSNDFFSIVRIPKKEKVKSILIIAFEDNLIINEIKNYFKGTSVNYLTKQDLNGKSIKDILQIARKNKYDLVIISNRFSLVNRSANSLKLIALFCKAKYSLIILNQQENIFYSRFILFMELIPRLIIFSILSIHTLIKAYLFFYLMTRFFKKPEFTSASGRKIAFFRTDLAGRLTVGGSISHIKGFISGAESLGFRITLISDEDFPGINTLRIIPNPFLDFFDEIQLIDYHFRFIREGKKILKNLKPDILYQRHSIFNASGVLLSMHFKIPLILEVNHSEVWVKKNWSRLFFERLATKIEKFAFENSDVIGAVSKITKEEISKLGANPDKIVVNPNGVDEIKFNPDIDDESIRQKFGLSEKFIVGFTGTFTRWHGVETLFNAALKICSFRNDISFLFIGDGNLRTALETETINLNLTDRIIFTGIVPHDDISMFLAACDVLVSPHLGFQSGERFFGSPTKLFEYMAMGKAIIASDLEQIGEIIQHDFNGLKFKPGDVDDLINNILRLVHEPELRIKLGNNARQSVIENYTWKDNAKRVLKRLMNLS